MGLPAISPNHWTNLEYLQAARDVLAQEQAALNHLHQNVPLAFADAVRAILECQGAVLVSGIGKAGWIGQKISASLASTGTRSHFVHPSEAVHGDFGRIGDCDLLLILSNSGNTPEVNQLLPTLRRREIPVMAITATEDSELGRAAQIVLAYGKHPEACHLNLAPSTSTMLMLALGDALCLVTARRRNWTAYDFSQHHPGGSLGLRLSNVEEIMRPLAQCRVAPQELTVREVFIKVSTTARRTGAVLLVDPAGKLAGLFTDSDLAKLLEQQRDGSLDRPISEVMTRRPYQVSEGTKTTQAVHMLARYNISELPVVNSGGQPTGIIDITDVLNLMPTNFTTPTVQQAEHEDPEPITLKIHHDSN